MWAEQISELGQSQKYRPESVNQLEFLKPDSILGNLYILPSCSRQKKGYYILSLWKEGKSVDIDSFRIVNVVEITSVPG